MVGDEDPRDVLRSIAYGKDPRIAPADRVRAIERLTELQQDDRRGQRIEDLSPEQVLEDAESLAAAMPGFLACARAALGESPDDVVEPPVGEEDLTETLALAVEVNDLQARRIIDLESALQRFTVHRLLPPAPEPVA